MNRSKQLRAARIVGGAVMLAAVVPAFTAGAALATDTDTPAVTATAAVEVDEVGIGTAVKLGNPDVVGAPAADTDADGRQTRIAPPATDETATATATTSPDEDTTDESTSEATPSDAEVIETESHQAVTPDPEVSVLGTKVGNELADTGSDVTGQLLAAIALIAAGLGLRFGPQLAVAAARRKH